MAEAEGDVNNKKKRRLPEWMFRTGSSSKEKQTEDDANKLAQPLSVPGSGATASDDFTFKEKDLELKKISKISQKDVLNNAVGCSMKSDLRKRPPKVDFKTVCKVKKMACTCEMKDGSKESGYLSSGGNEDELELTVNDLISIAREYVKADEEGKRVGRGTQKSNPNSSSAFKSSCDGDSDIGGVSELTAVSRGSRIMPETERNSSDHLELGSAATTSSRSGDAAQDMLDLFLGPLLKKPDPRGHEPEKVAADDMAWYSADTSKNTISQPAMFSDPLIRKPDLWDWKSEIVAADGTDWPCATSSKHAAAEADGRTEVVVEKKKSSLKDKVTMLLD